MRPLVSQTVCSLQGTIPILHQQKEWVGEWAFLLTFIFCIFNCGLVRKSKKYADVIQGWSPTEKWILDSFSNFMNISNKVDSDS